MKYISILQTLRIYKRTELKRRCYDIVECSFYRLDNYHQLLLTLKLKFN